MTETPRTLFARPNDTLPASDLGTFEIVRRLPVTTWALRPHTAVPSVPPSREAATAAESVGRLAGWIEATPWCAPVLAQLSSKYTLPRERRSLRTTSAWLGIASDSQDRLATVPPPPQWLGAILTGWDAAVTHNERDGSSDTPNAFERASWTLWLFGITQPFSNASDSIAGAHAAQMIARSMHLPAPLIAGWPARDPERITLQRLRANALDLVRYERWHRAWLTEVAHEADRLLDTLRALGAERARIIGIASAMRAPRHCVALAESLVAQPRMTVADSAARMELTFRAAQAIVDKFVSDGILRETTGRKRDRVYQCDATANLVIPAAALTEPGPAVTPLARRP
ncbi:MAG: hypothetical protein EXS03_06840 [Phycisphaerales bacterium]|nr:hypothetical protein [Phycisphaerales bacterium]